MTFVDDVRNIFDAAEFCATVTAGVGEGRVTSGIALRDSVAANAALSALRAFHTRAVSPEKPDVIAAYLAYSPPATELFTALRAVTTYTPLASAALDCLTALVRYSLEPSNPVQALDATRSVTKEVVKSRAVLIYDVFVSARALCCKKALNLLRLVSQCHPMLAKEIVNRFNLASDVMAPALCSYENHICRVPFLDLIFCLLASGDYDVINALCTRYRLVLIHCLRVIKLRTLKESNEDHPDVVYALGQQELRQRKRERWKKEDRPNEKGKAKEVIAPSHIQKTQLIASINLLLAIERHILCNPNQVVRRAAFQTPIPEMLCAIAAADMPPLKIAPRQVIPEHEALRETASSLFLSVATDLRIGSINTIAVSLNKAAIMNSTASVDFVLRVIGEQPKVCKRMLETGQYFSQPAVTSVWIGKAAIISACVLRLSSATPRFLQTKFFERCLDHTDALVRHTGVLIMLAFCKVMRADKHAAEEPQNFLPPFRVVELLLKREKADEDCQKLLAAYQELFEGHADEIQADLVKLSVETSGEDLALSYDTIVAGLALRPRETAESLLRKKYVSKMVLQAASTNDKAYSARLWHLCREVLRSTDLFPRGTETEIDIYLAFLSASGSHTEDCSVEFELLVIFAMDTTPYALFDELQSAASSCKDGKETIAASVGTSLLSVAAVFRLRKLKSSAEDHGLSRKHVSVGGMLFGALEVISACQKVLGIAPGCTWLDDIIFPFAETWSANQDVFSNSELVHSSRCIQRLFSRTVLYPRTPYLHFMNALSAANVLHFIHGTDKAMNGISVVSLSTLWLTWVRFRDTKDSQALISPLARATIITAGEQSSGILSSFAIVLVLEGITGGAENIPALLEATRTLKDRLSASELAVFMCMALRIAKDGEAPFKFAGNAMDLLLRFENKKDRIESAKKLVSALQGALLEGASMDFGCEPLEIDLLLRSALEVLELRSGTHRNAEFAISLLLKLVRHGNERILLHSRRFLLKASEANVSLPSHLSLSSSKQLSALMPYFPALQRGILTQVTSSSPLSLLRKIPQSLPVLCAVLKSGDYSSLKNEIGFDESEVFRSILSALVESKSFFDHGQIEDHSVIARSLAEIGRIMLASGFSLNTVLNALKQPPSKGGKVLCENVLFLTQKVFLEENDTILREQLDDTHVVDTLRVILEWFNSCQIRLDHHVHRVTLQVFYGLLKHLRTRRLAIYTVAKDAISLEKSLTAFCSNVLKSIHRKMGCCAGDSASMNGTPSTIVGEIGDASAIHLPLKCAREVLKLDLLLDKAAKRTIFSIGAHDGGLMLACLQRISDKGYENGVSENSVTAKIASLLLACLGHLPRFGIDAEVAERLIVVEGVFSLELSGYTGTSCEDDVTIRTCMDEISQHLKANDAREKLELQERRTGYFGPFCSQVLRMFNKKRMTLTSYEMFRDHREVSKDYMVASNQGDVMEWPYDPVFVLRTFLSACGEALNNPGNAILDIGKVARDGVLDVTLFGLASENDDVRQLSYACLGVFARVVGPTAGVPLGSASALYKDRKQLSFLLTLLMNSISDPLARVLPLFAVWFSLSLRTALSPRNVANKAVTFFFLRAPTMDVTDCAGVSYLLRCDAFGAELQSTRLLALEILRCGVHTVHDLVVLRRRKIVGTLLMLGGSSCGINVTVRTKALTTLQAIISRDRKTGISQDLVSSHDIIPWLVIPSGYREEKPDMILKRKLNILKHLSASRSFRKDSDKFLAMFSRALAAFCRVISDRPNFPGKAVVENLVIDCANCICSLAPRHRQLVLVDKAFLNDGEVVNQLANNYNGTAAAKIAGIVARQSIFDIKPALHQLLLRVSIQKCEDIVGTPTNIATLEHDQAVEICMLHAFVAESLLREGRRERSEKIGPDLCLTLAKAMSRCPTLWLVMASISILDMQEKLSSKLKRQAKKLPSSVPRVLNLDEDRRFCGIVDKVQMVLIDELISSSPIKSP